MLNRENGGTGGDMVREASSQIIGETGVAILPTISGKIVAKLAEQIGLMCDSPREPMIFMSNLVGRGSAAKFAMKAGLRTKS